MSLPPELEMLPQSVLGDIHSTFIDTWHQLTSLISQVRKCQSLVDYYLLQEKLGSRILLIDGEIDAVNIVSSQVTKALNKLGNYADPEKKLSLCGKLRETDLKRHLYLLAGKQYRT